MAKVLIELMTHLTFFVLVYILFHVLSSNMLVMQEKCSKPFNLASNTVRWTMGPNGTVVTFSEDIGLPSIFQTIPNRYSFAT
jgi:hypothetical protein